MEVQSGNLILILVVRGGYLSQNLVVQKSVHGGAFWVAACCVKSTNTALMEISQWSFL